MIPSATWPKGGEPLWRVLLEAPDEFSAESFAEVLEGLGGAISAFETEPQGPWKVESFVQGKPDLSQVEGGLSLVALQFGLEPPSVTLEQLPDVDWVRENQESFPPLRIGRYFVYGSHIAEAPPVGSIGLEIDAASAFGTGEHATTAGCLLALSRIAKRGKRRRILDMGGGHRHPGDRGGQDVGRAGAGLRHRPQFGPGRGRKHGGEQCPASGDQPRERRLPGRNRPQTRTL